MLTRAELQSKRDTQFNTLLKEWKAMPLEMEGRNNFLASRSYAWGHNPISGPYFRKLHREGSLSKHYGEYARKTGIEAQCISLVNESLKALPYHGAGDLFQVPDSAIVRDFGQNRGGKLSIFDRDAWTSRAYHRPMGALHPKQKYVVSDFTGRRKYQRGYEKYAYDDLKSLIHALVEENAARLAQCSLKSMSDFKEKYPYNIDLLPDNPQADSLQKNHIYFKIEAELIHYSVIDRHGKKFDHQMSFEEFEKLGEIKLRLPLPENTVDLKNYFKEIESELKKALIKKKQISLPWYPENSLFVEKIADNQLKVITTFHGASATPGYPLKITLEEMQAVEQSLSSLDDMDNPIFQETLKKVALAKGYLGIRITEINANLQANNLVASYYKLESARSIKINVIYDRLVDCLMNRKLHELYGMGARINEIPIVYFTATGEIHHDRFLEEQSLEELFFIKLQQQAAIDPSFDLKKSVETFIKRFFYTGIEGTESLNFSTNQEVENYVFGEFKDIFLKKYSNASDQGLLQETFHAVREQIEESKSKSTKKQIIRRDMQNIFRTLQLIDRHQNEMHSRFYSLFLQLKINYAGVDPKSDEAMLKKDELVFQLQPKNNQEEPVYKLSFPVSGGETLWGEYARGYLYCRQILNHTKGRNNIIHLANPPDPKALSVGFYVYKENNQSHIMIKHLDEKFEDINLDEEMKASGGHRFSYRLRKKIGYLLENHRKATIEERKKLSEQIIQLITSGCEHNPVTAEQVSLFTRPFMEISNDGGKTFQRITDLDENLRIFSELRAGLSNEIKDIKAQLSASDAQDRWLCARLKSALNCALEEYYTSKDSGLETISSKLDQTAADLEVKEEAVTGKRESLDLGDDASDDDQEEYNYSI